MHGLPVCFPLDLSGAGCRGGNRSHHGPWQGQPGGSRLGPGHGHRHRHGQPQGQPENAAGEAFDIVAGEQVTNLANLKVGDVVALRYLQMLDLELLKGTAGGKRIVEVAAGKAEAGKKPGAGIGKRSLYGDVIAVDKGQQTITVKGWITPLVLKVHNPAQFALIARATRSRPCRPRRWDRHSAREEVATA